MRRAWEIYKKLQGDRLAKLSMALRMAWAETRQTVLEGTEKQVAWAKDIRTKLLSYADGWLADFGALEGKTMVKRIEATKKFMSDIKATANAKWIIDNRDTTCWAYGR